ncbi:LysR family transcriptional regulator [Shewanella sp. OPT22]|nr:LysR family transcriptional regulator [Shewanella sp. OPT22]
MNSSWDDYRSAFEVAKVGSLSQAAKHLGISHSTVLRHIDRLEQRLMTKLFIRHQRGYRLTESGQVLLAELPLIQHQISKMEARIQDTSDELSGNLVITTVPSYAPRMHKAFKALMDRYPRLHLTMLATDEVINLASGTVHVAVRPGNKPNSSDLIVKPLSSAELKIYASQQYAKLNGLPTNINELNGHKWVMPTGFKRHIPIFKPLFEKIDQINIVYQSNHFSDIAFAVTESLGLGIVSANFGINKGLVETPYQIDGHSEQNWFIYHKDLRNSRKVAVLYDYLAEYLT